MRGDRGRVVIGGLAKIAGLLAVIVVMFHDGISLGLAQVNADSDAQVAARAAAQAWDQTKDTDIAFNRASITAEENGSSLVPSEFVVNSRTGEVTVEATRTADTMVAKYFGWLDDLVNPAGTASARVVR